MIPEIDVYDYMEDFDNAELNSYDRKEQLLEAVRDYNETYNTEHDPEKTYKKYLRQQSKYDM